MKKTLKKIPKFNDERKERAFWQTHDSTEYVDDASLENWSFPNLKQIVFMSLQNSDPKFQFARS